MKSKLIKDQLLKLERAIPDSFDKPNKTYHIPIFTGEIYEKGKAYLVKDTSTNSYYRIMVLKQDGVSIYVDALEVDELDITIGMTKSMWLNTRALEKIKFLG